MSYIIYCIVTLVLNLIFISLFHLFLFNYRISFYFKEINVINLRLIQILFHSDGASCSADKIKICSKKGLVRQTQEQTNKPRKLVKLGNAGLLFLWYSRASTGCLQVGSVSTAHLQLSLWNKYFTFVPNTPRRTRPHTHTQTHGIEEMLVSCNTHTHTATHTPTHTNTCEISRTPLEMAKAVKEICIFITT